MQTNQYFQCLHIKIMSKNMKILAFFLSLLCSVSLLAQTGYSGFVHKSPITLVTDIYSDGDARAIYAYNKYDTPIPIHGVLNENKLELYEKNENGITVAILAFDDFDADAPQLSGKWINRKTKKTLDIQLSNCLLYTSDAADE